MAKLTKLEAGYDTELSTGRRCSDCKYYHPGSCELVSGVINPLRCCNLWRRSGSGAFPHWLSGVDVNRKLKAPEGAESLRGE